MGKTTATRLYSLVNGTLDLGAAGLLFLVHQYNVAMGGENLIIAWLALPMCGAFLLMGVFWSIDTVKPGLLRRWLPGGEDSESRSMLAPVSQLEAPTPLPDTFCERCGSASRRVFTAPVRAIARTMSRKRQAQLRA